MDRVAGHGGRAGRAGRNAGTTAWHAVAVSAVVTAGATAAAFAVARRFVTVDGLAYLDMADVYLDQGWAAGTNGYWGPLYPLLLAAAFRLFGRDRAHELVVVHGVNLVVYLLALAAFLFFWRELDRLRNAPTTPFRTLPTWAWWAVGYALFLWCALRLNQIWTPSPDMLVIASVLAAGGLLLRIRRDPAGWGAPLALGGVLGAGYLAKAVMFPVSALFLAGVLGAAGAGRRGGDGRAREGWLGAAAARAGVAALVLSVVAAPYLVTLSLQKERLTFGDSGRLNYARYVNGVPNIHWQGEVPGNGTPVHPTRRLARAPAVFEFAEPVRGTYPPWYDPSYWYEGVQTRFDPTQQAAAFVRTGRVYVDLFLLRQGAAVGVVALLLAAMGPLRRSGLEELGRLWFLWLPAVGTVGLYALVYTETRYVAGFLPLAWGAVLASLRLPETPWSDRLLPAAGGLIAAVFALNLATPNEKALARFLEPAQPMSNLPAFDVGYAGSLAHLPAARALADLGLSEGDEVAFIGYGYDAYWARLAGVRVIAEVPFTDTEVYWRADEKTRERTLDTLLSTGASAVVILADPSRPAPAGWIQLGDTAYYVLLSREASPP
jgi:hypothetical protein